MPGWVLWLLVGAGIVGIYIVIMYVIMPKQAAKARHEQEEALRARKRREEQEASAAKHAAEQACGLWCSWEPYHLDTSALELTAHNVSSEAKEQKEAWFRAHPPRLGAPGGAMWLPQTEAHRGDAILGCATCELLMDAHNLALVDLRRSPRRYASSDGHYH